MTKPLGAVNHETLKNLRDRYRAVHGSEWPHDDEYLKLLWQRAREDVPANKAGFNIARYEVAVNAMLENSEVPA